MLNVPIPSALSAQGTVTAAMPVLPLDASGNVIGGTASPIVVNANRATYCATTLGYAGYATPTDMVSIFGSATKTVAVTRFAVSIHSTTAILAVVDFVKRSAANSGGTPTALTAVPYDSASAAATAVVSTYAAAPTTGAAVGTVRTHEAVTGTLLLQPASYAESNVGAQPIAPISAVNHASPIILRGVAEGLCINYRGAALPGGFTAYVIAEWVEY